MELKNITDFNVKTTNDDLEIKIKIKRNKATELSLDNIVELYYNDMPLNISIEPFKKEASLSANNYAWVLITKIAQAITSTKEEVYKTLIRDYGVCSIETIPKNVYMDIVNEWKSNGLGYIVEELFFDEDSVTAFFYKGIHGYNSYEMNRFLEGVIFEATMLDIETRTPQELEKNQKNFDFAVEANKNNKISP